MSSFTVHNNAPVWIQIPAFDVPRATGFYKSALSFHIRAFEPGKSDSADVAHFSFPDTPFQNILTGGIMKRKPEHSTPDPRETGPAVLYFYVENLEETIAKVIEAGGKQLTGRTPEGKSAWYMDFRDTEGNFYGIYSMNDKK